MEGLDIGPTTDYLVWSFVWLLVGMEGLDSGPTTDYLVWNFSETCSQILSQCQLGEYAPQCDLIKLRAQTRRGIFLGKFLNYSHVLQFMDSLTELQQAGFKWERHHLFDRIRKCVDEIERTLAPLADDVPEAYAVAVVAVALLSYVYRYLTGCGGWDGSRAVSSGSLDYRDTYIAILLFRGAYVWIKSRDVAPTKSKGVRRKENGKYELRFKPPRDNGVIFDYFHIGRFDSQADADIVYRMTNSCYPNGEDSGGLVDLAGDGLKLFPITPEFSSEEKGWVGKAKNDLVKKRVLEHFKLYKTEKDALNLPPTLPGASLEQELENHRLQNETKRLRQRNEDLERRLQQSEIHNQNLQLQVKDLHEPMTPAEIDSLMYELQGEDLQLQFQDQQAQQFQALDLQPQPQLSSLQQHQREEELFTIGENCDVPFATEPLPVVPGFGADIDGWINMEPFQEEAGFGGGVPNLLWGDIQLMDETTT